MESAPTAGGTGAYGVIALVLGDGGRAEDGIGEFDQGFRAFRGALDVMSRSIRGHWRGAPARQREGDKAVAEAANAGSNAETLRALALKFQPVNGYRLKHSFAAWLLLSYDNTELVQKALGHTSEKMTSIYTMMAVDPRLAGARKKAFCFVTAWHIRVATSTSS